MMAVSRTIARRQSVRTFIESSAPLTDMPAAPAPQATSRPGSRASSQRSLVPQGDTASESPEKLRLEMEMAAPQLPEPAHTPPPDHRK